MPKTSKIILLNLCFFFFGHLCIAQKYEISVGLGFSQNFAKIQKYNWLNPIIKLRRGVAESYYLDIRKRFKNEKNYVGFSIAHAGLANIISRSALAPRFDSTLQAINSNGRSRSTSTDNYTYLNFYGGIKEKWGRLHLFYGGGVSLVKVVEFTPSGFSGRAIGENNVFILTESQSFPVFSTGVNGILSLSYQKNYRHAFGMDIRGVLSSKIGSQDDVYVDINGIKGRYRFEQKGTYIGYAFNYTYTFAKKQPKIKTIRNSKIKKEIDTTTIDIPDFYVPKYRFSLGAGGAKPHVAWAYGWLPAITQTEHPMTYIVSADISRRITRKWYLGVGYTNSSIILGVRSHYIINGVDAQNEPNSFIKSPRQVDNMSYNALHVYATRQKTGHKFTFEYGGGIVFANIQDKNVNVGNIRLKGYDTYLIYEPTYSTVGGIHLGLDYRIQTTYKFDVLQKHGIFVALRGVKGFSRMYSSTYNFETNKVKGTYYQYGKGSFTSLVLGYMYHF